MKAFSEYDRAMNHFIKLLLSSNASFHCMEDNEYRVFSTNNVRIGEKKLKLVIIKLGKLVQELIADCCSILEVLSETVQERAAKWKSIL